MRPAPNKLMERYRTDGPVGTNCGFFVIPFGPIMLRVMICDGAGWDHVSVSTPKRCPDWSEMSMVKAKCFLPDECVMELHVPESQHINYHANCLHLWRPQTDAEIAVIRKTWGDEWLFGDIRSPGTIPRPPAVMVGPQAKRA